MMRLIRWGMIIALAAILPAATTAASLVWGTGKWGDTWGTASSSTSSAVLPSSSGTAVSTQGGKPSTSVAKFSIGLTRDNGLTFQQSVGFGENVEIIGYITPELAQLGKTADIYVLALVGQTYFMRKANGSFVPWSGKIQDLVPYVVQKPLSESVKVDIYTGSLSVRGEISIFIGYLRGDGVLYYITTPVQITVN